MDLEALRKQIDEIDTEMCDLFAQRMKVVTDIARYKKENKRTAQCLETLGPRVRGLWPNTLSYDFRP